MMIVVYENSGFSRTVHFDASLGLPSPDEPGMNYDPSEVYAQKRKGILYT